MSIVYTFLTAKLRYKVAGKNSIQVDGANTISGIKKKIKEQPRVKLQIHHLTCRKKAAQSFLLIRLVPQWSRTADFTTDKRNMVTRIAQRRTDTMHPLIVVQIVGNGKNNSGFHLQMQGLACGKKRLHRLVIMRQGHIVYCYALTCYNKVRRSFLRIKSAGYN